MVRDFCLSCNRERNGGDTLDLIQACAPHWNEGEITEFENAVLAYRPPVPGHLEEPSQRKTFADYVRATRKDLLKAAGLERLSASSQELAATEERALGDRFDRSVHDFEGGFIGSPMSAAAMVKAKDRDILNILREVPDNTNWDHPKDWMRGGSIQLSRDFADFAKQVPERAVRLIEQFEPKQQERPAGYALEALADDAKNDELTIEAFLDLHQRGFDSIEFRESAARAMEKVAHRQSGLSDEVIATLVSWLSLPGRGSEEDEKELKNDAEKADAKDGSVLWGLGSATSLPAGNFNVLSALASILLSRKEPGRDQYFKILEEHLPRERDPNVWKALLYRLSNAGGSTPEVVSTFLRKMFERYPALLETHEAVIFLAHAQRWDDQLVFDLIQAWKKSQRPFLQQAYGELVGLISTLRDGGQWTDAKGAIIASGTEDEKAGLAYAAVNLWSDDNWRRTSGETLVTLLEGGASRDLTAAILDIFRVVDELPLDEQTANLLRALANPKLDLSGAPSHFIVERLQSVLPHHADLIAAIAEKLIAAWRDELGDIRTGTVTAAPQLTDLALTLHRLGGESRKAGIAIFEAMIEIDAYGARDTLIEIDGRFSDRPPAIRQGLSRRRPARARRRRAG